MYMFSAEMQVCKKIGIYCYNYIKLLKPNDVLYVNKLIRFC